MISLRLFSLSARLSALVISIWGALLGLTAPTSLVARIHDEIDGPMDIVNLSILTVAALGVADVIWHDIRGKLIWPSFDPRKRHKVCVLVYSFFGATWLVKSFVSAAAIGLVSGAPAMLGFAVSMAAICGITAFAIAFEQR